VVATQVENWGSVLAARRGELVDTSTLEGFVATVGGQRVGLALTALRGTELEVVSISTSVHRRGIGRALLERCVDEARSRRCTRVWLVTTNDNIGAIAFYQHLGMDLRAIHRHGVTASRRLKPEIPLRNAEGLPIEDELEFQVRITQCDHGRTGHEGGRLDARSDRRPPPQPWGH
jgi:GNAT superfamily N-acetyltransferase